MTFSCNILHHWSVLMPNAPCQSYINPCVMLTLVQHLQRWPSIDVLCFLSRRQHVYQLWSQKTTHVDLMLGHHLSRWANINPMGQRVLFAGMPVCPAIWRMRVGYQLVVHTLQAHCDCLVKTKGSICLLYKWAGTTFWLCKSCWVRSLIVVIVTDGIQRQIPRCSSQKKFLWFFLNPFEIIEREQS